MFKKNLLYFFFKRTITFVVILSLFTTSILYPNPAKAQVISVETYDCHVQSLTNVNVDIVKSYDYDPFGNIRTSSGTNNTNYEFQGQQLDPESSMYFLRARYYDPTVGRFITRDPVKGLLSNPQTLNPYAYAANNPINLQDPSGEAWFLYLLDAAGTTLDAISLSEAISNCDWGGAALSGISLGIPFVSFGGIRLVNKAVDAAKALKIVIKHEHAGRHLVGTNLTEEMVEAAIRADLTKVGQLKPSESLIRTIQVGGETIEYHPYGLSDGTINVGTYFIPGRNP